MSKLKSVKVKQMKHSLQFLLLIFYIFLRRITTYTKQVIVLFLLMYYLPTHAKPEEIPYYVLPDVNKSSEIAIDEEEQNKILKKPYRYAKQFQLNINLKTSSSTSIQYNKICYKYGITGYGAYALQAIIKELVLPSGSSLAIYDPQKIDKIQIISPEENYSDRILPSANLRGDSLIIEFQVPIISNNEFQASLSKVHYAYRDIFDEVNLKTAQSCEIDVNCPDFISWRNEKRSVVKLYFDGTYCTGVLLNNIRQDTMGYILTANHCIKTNSIANETVFTFLYEDNECSTGILAPTTNLFGSTLKATYEGTDFTLLKLSQPIPSSCKPYFAGWDATNSNPTTGTCIHHPQGDLKKISIENDNPLTSTLSGYNFNAHYLIKRWEHGATEGGSSGSPLFDQNHRVIGQLTGGESSCNNPINDYYGKIARSYKDLATINSQLKYWLDPDNTGKLFVDGFGYGSEVCEAFSNYKSDTNAKRNFQLYNFTSWGEASGHNSDSALAFAEKFYFKGPCKITSIDLNINKLKIASPLNSYLYIKLWSAKNGLPDSSILSQKVFLNTLEENSKNTIEITNIPTIYDTIFAGFTINYIYNDTLSLYGLYNTLPSQSFVNLKNTWKPFSYEYADTIKLGIGIHRCYEESLNIDEKKEDNHNSIWSLYPNPVKDNLTIDLPELFNNARYNIYNILGEQVSDGIILTENSTISVSHLRKGIYSIVIFGNNEKLSSKFIKN